MGAGAMQASSGARSPIRRHRARPREADRGGARAGRIRPRSAQKVDCAVFAT
ncbi:hypothetical protein [Lysobacter gummosus]|uniref:hypothetical protein n=1 Tax=Lysobacter gummosus TaxID=262324 RepID=UPI003636F2FE